ncbi:hypothetical protein BDR07DRAFT_1279206, partial [Suillus spraguei]
AAEIMKKQGASLVDRPRFIAAGELLWEGMVIPFVPAGERFHRLHKLCRAIHTHLQPKAAEAYQPLQISPSLTFLKIHKIFRIMRECRSKVRQHGVANKRTEVTQ